MATDESSDVTPPAIVLDEHDTAAVVALLIRTVRLDEELARDQALVAEATARIATNKVARSKTVTAFGVFGFETGAGLWKRVGQAIGQHAYHRAVEIAQGHESPKLLEKMREDEKAGGAQSNTQNASETEDTTVSSAPSIKDAILEFVRNAGQAGTSAREVRQHLTDSHNLNVHEKTPGMTLYRLLKDNLVRREGRRWYATAAGQNNEIEAPNGGPQGASDTAHAAP